MLESANKLIKLHTWILQTPDFDGKEISLKLNSDGNLGTFEGSSGNMNLLIGVFHSQFLFLVCIIIFVNNWLDTCMWQENRMTWLVSSPKRQMPQFSYLLHQIPKLVRIFCYWELLCNIWISNGFGNYHWIKLMRLLQTPNFHTLVCIRYSFRSE